MGAKNWGGAEPCPKSIRRMSRLAARIRISVLCLAVVLATSLAVRRATNEWPRYAVTLTAHTVVRGDTLWSVARKYNPEQYAPKVVYEIRTASGKEVARLKPGEKLVVPVYKREPRP